MEYGRKEDKMGTYTKNLKLETPNYTDNADIPALTKKNNEIIDSEMIKRANGLDYNEQTGVLQLTGNNSKVGNPIQIKNNLPVTSMSSGTELKINNYKGLIKFTKEGKSTQDGTPTPDAPVEIISIPSVENLMKLKAGETRILNGITAVVQEDGGLKVTGTATDTTQFTIPLENPVTINNNTFTFSTKSVGSVPSNATRLLKLTSSSMTENSFGGTFVTLKSNNTVKIVSSITDEEIYNYYFFFCNKDFTVDAVLYPQLEKGSIAHLWRPYGNYLRIDNNGNPIFVNMQDKKLCSNKDETIKDKLIIYDNGKTEINKKIGEVVLDGSESGWERGTSTSGNYYYQLNMENLKPAINNASICNIKCSHFESKSANDIWAGIKGISVRVNISGFRFCYVNDKTDTLEKWKAYLQEQYNAGNPVKVQYELAEPETIDLGITDFNLLEGNSELTCEEESNMQLDYLTIDSNIFVQDSLDGNSSQKAPSINAVNEIISKLEARIIALENKNV